MVADGASQVDIRKVAAGVWLAPGARIIDRIGRKRLPVGDDGFEWAAGYSALVGTTGFIANVLGSGYTSTPLCRPHRSGKTFNMTTIRVYF